MPPSADFHIEAEGGISHTPQRQRAIVSSSVATSLQKPLEIDGEAMRRPSALWKENTGYGIVGGRVNRFPRSYLRCRRGFPGRRLSDGMGSSRSASEKVIELTGAPGFAQWAARMRSFAGGRGRSSLSCCGIMRNRCWKRWTTLFWGVRC